MSRLVRAREKKVDGATLGDRAVWVHMENIEKKLAKFRGSE